MQRAHGAGVTDGKVTVNGQLGMVPTPNGRRWSASTAFGPGEVLVDGRKLVGISQRRTQGGPRACSAAGIARYDPACLVGLLNVAGRPAVAVLAPVAAFDPADVQSVLGGLARSLRRKR